MRKFFGLICIVWLLGSCGTTDKLTGRLMIIDPTTPEDELDERVQELKAAKAQSASKKQESVTLEKPQPEKNTASEEPLMSFEETQEASINLLEKKGMINR